MINTLVSAIEPQSHSFHYRLLKGNSTSVGKNIAKKINKIAYAIEYAIYNRICDYISHIQLQHTPYCNISILKSTITFQSAVL